MAIADIITRIEQDAQAEAEAIIAAARQRADAIVAEAQTDSEKQAARIKAHNAEAARVEAEMLLANARLAARDELLRAKQELAGRVIAGVRTALETLPDDDYAAFIARETARVAVPGQHVRVAAADVQRLADLAARVAALGVEITMDGEADGLARGVSVESDGVRVEVSPAAYVAERHGDILQIAVRELFPGEG